MFYNMPPYMPYPPPPGPTSVKELKQLLKLYKTMEKETPKEKKKEEVRHERDLFGTFMMLTIAFPLVGFCYSYAVIWGIKTILDLVQTIK